MLSKTLHPDSKQRQRTPAMAASIVDSVWSFERFLRTPTFPAIAQSLNPKPLTDSLVTRSTEYIEDVIRVALLTVDAS